MHSVSLSSLLKKHVDGNKIQLTFLANLKKSSIKDMQERIPSLVESRYPISAFFNLAIAAPSYAADLSNQCISLSEMIATDFSTEDAAVTLQSHRDAHLEPLHVRGHYYKYVVRLVNHEGDSYSEIATCGVSANRFGVHEAAWQNFEHLVAARVSALQKSNGASVSKLTRHLVNVAFPPIMKHWSHHRGINEIVIDSECNDGLALVSLPSCDASEEKFALNPFWVHLLIQARLYISAACKCEEYGGEVLFAGLGPFQTRSNLRQNSQYTVYVKLRTDKPGNSPIPGTFFLPGQDRKLVTVCDGLKFHVQKGSVHD